MFELIDGVPIVQIYKKFDLSRKSGNAIYGRLVLLRKNLPIEFAELLFAP